MAGYSGRSLVEKLGIKPNTRAAILRPPKGYRRTLGKLPAGVTTTGAVRGRLSFIQVFSSSSGDLAAVFPRLAKALDDDGMLWVSWPKRTSGVATDLTEDGIRAIGLPHGLVDVKVCAVDDTWSGLKFVRRLSNRVARA
jgi:hypothetical protein